MKSSKAYLLSGVFFLALILFFVAERILAANQQVRIILDSLGAFCLLCAIIGRMIAIRLSSDINRKIAGQYILVFYLIGLVGLLGYFLPSDLFKKMIFAGLAEEKLKNIQVILNILWPIIMLTAVLPVMFMELSYLSMARARLMEVRRIAYSRSGGLTLALALAFLGMLNYLASQHDYSKDLSYFKTTEPSETSVKMVESLTEPFDVVLFFPKANEVQEELDRYFTTLAHASELIKVASYDFLMEPQLAEKYKVAMNGVVVFGKGAASEKYSIGLEMSRAKSKLQKLDSEFQKYFLKLMRPRSVIYFTTGHKEREFDATGSDKAESISVLKTILQDQNFEIKTLGVSQGLAQEIPEDARVVFVVGPKENFLKEELETLSKYLKKGGNLFLMLDPENDKVDFSSLLKEFSLKYTPELLANDRYFVRRYYTASDRSILFTNRYSSHPSVSTLSRNSSKLATIFIGSGYLTKLEADKKGTDAKDEAKIHFTVSSMPQTWNDVNKDTNFNEKSEQQKIYDMIAAVARPLPKTEMPVPAKDAKIDPKQAPADKTETRLIVAADSGFVSDQLLANQGNYYLLADGLKWLLAEEEYAGTVSSEEDVRLEHTKKENMLWFYSTIVVIPLVILVGGLFYTRRRKNKK
jgi:hypothetical protein